MIEQTTDWHHWSTVDQRPVSGQPVNVVDTNLTADPTVIYRASTR